MLKKCLGASAVALLVCSPALARAPTLSGNYVYTWIEQCRVNETTIGQTVGTISFDPATQTATLSGNHIGGTSLSMSPISGSAPYSNTATTFTLSGHKFQAVYGKVIKGVVAQSVSYIGIVPGDGGITCGDEVLLSHE